jgi:hypothetical protein
MPSTSPKAGCKPAGKGAAQWPSDSHVAKRPIVQCRTLGAAPYARKTGNFGSLGAVPITVETADASWQAMWIASGGASGVDVGRGG